MPKTLFEISMSLDGFVAGSRDGPQLPMGEGGEQLHDWMFGKSTDRDAAMVREALERPGAFLIGRRMFDNGEEPWGDEPTFPAPVFVVTHNARPPVVRGGTTFTFVTEGIESALAAARAAAGGRM